MIHEALEQALGENTEVPEPGSVEGMARSTQSSVSLEPPALGIPPGAEEDQQAPVSEPPAGTSPKRHTMVGPCDTTCKWLSGVLAAAGIGALIALDPESNGSIGNVTLLLPPVAGFAMTLLGGDMQGLKQWSLVGASSLLTTSGLKYLSDKERPNYHNNQSFPSGHATGAFFGAGFIYRRYGPRWGVPAYVVAAYTAATRVDVEAHYVDDVVSSFSIGLMSNWLFTTPISDRVAINPMLANDRVGFTVSVATTGASGENGSSVEDLRPTHYRYQWEFGPATVVENSVTSGAGSDPIDFRFDQQNNPLYTAQIGLDWYIGSQPNDVAFSFAPFEIRDFGSFEADTDFGDVVFPPGEDLRSRAVAYDLTALYRHRLWPDSHFDVRVGGGGAVLYTLAGLAPVDLLEPPRHLSFEQASALTVLPVLHFHLGYDFGKNMRWSLFGEATGMEISSDRYFDATAQVRFRITPRWDVGLGYRHLERSVDTNSLSTTTTRNQYVAAIGYRF